MNAVASTTEISRREMYQQLAALKSSIPGGFFAKAQINNFESAMEAYLGELQNTNYSEFLMLRDKESQRHLGEQKEIQERLNTVDNAYRIAQQAADAAGEELRETQALIRKQREMIGKLHMENAAMASRGDARSTKACKCTSSHVMAVIGAVVDVQTALANLKMDHQNYAAINKIQAIVDGSQLKTAMLSFEGLESWVCKCGELVETTKCEVCGGVK